ncbi:pyridoxal phosphate-dependent aminotransferase [Methanoplanus endosymbiosus]|uniref:Aminotransferase n=1 Tax=Methanoplanus endosymbiosus TaxID=33865 RepID=A0A9E7TK17_9EURY|nr:histidinol-phosphate transaminase [Methanoplanus endosymbiosus]UUX92354.1 histidinol-phosphate aminotransferase family protein [Methanoplanus endosymbiosus]
MKKHFPNKVVHGGLLQLGQNNNGKYTADYSASINPWPPETGWKPDFKRIKDYPDDTYTELKEEISTHHGVKTENISVGNGSVEIIRSLFKAVLNPGENVLTERHTFGEYRFSAELAGASCSHDPATPHRLRVICNPNNPSGKILSASEILAIADDCSEKGIMLYIDEAFMDLADRDESVADCGYENVIVSRSLTKSFAIPGLRIGYGIGSPSVTKKIEAARLPWTVNFLAESFAVSAIRNYDRLEESRIKIRTERDYLCNGLEKLGLEYHPPSANYILFSTGILSSELTQKLLEKGFYVRNCTSFGLPHSIRIAVRKREDNERLLEALRECLP